MSGYQPKLDLDQIDLIFTQIEREDGMTAQRIPAAQACIIPDYDSELYRQRAHVQLSFPGYRSSASLQSENYRRKAALTGPNVSDSEFKLSFPKDDLLRKEESAKSDILLSFPSDEMYGTQQKDSTHRPPHAKPAAVGSLQFTSKLLLDQERVATGKPTGTEKVGMATPRGLQNVSFVIPYIVDEGYFQRFKTATLAQSTTGAKTRAQQEIPDYGHGNRKKGHLPDAELVPSMPMLLEGTGHPEKQTTAKARTKRPADVDLEARAKAPYSMAAQQHVETVEPPPRIFEMQYSPPETRRCKGYHCWRRYVEAPNAPRAADDLVPGKDQQQLSAKSVQLPSKKPVQQPPATEKTKKQPLPFTLIKQTPEPVISQPSQPAFQDAVCYQQYEYTSQDPTQPALVQLSRATTASSAFLPEPKPSGTPRQEETPYNYITAASPPPVARESRYEAVNAVNTNVAPKERFQDSINLMPKAEQAQFLMGLIAPYEAQILQFQQQELFSDNMAQQAVLAADDDMARYHLLVREQARAYREQLQRKLDSLDARLHELFKEDLYALKRSMAARK